MAPTCPGCESDVLIEESLVQNEIIECAQCRAELEVVVADPVVLALAPEVEEDWGE